MPKVRTLTDKVNKLIGDVISTRVRYYVISVSPDAEAKKDAAAFWVRRAKLKMLEGLEAALQEAYEEGVKDERARVNVQVPRVVRVDKGTLTSKFR